MLSFLYNIIISPIELAVEFVFEIMFRMVGQRETNQGLAVIGVSVAISLLTLPLYYRADAVQQKERDLNKRLSRWTNHIRNTFKGDERFMMQQAYYRENGYSPLQALNGSISLLLEIPFFIAAYHFLSNLTVLNGASFGPIANLGAPDHLIKIGSFYINLLPVLMTTINCISSAIYLKGFPIKDKIQTYGMALIFLVLLYNSPSGLVVYWTCNNIFGLVKNIFYKLKNPKKILVILIAVLGSMLSFLAFISGKLNSQKKYIFVLFFQYLVLLPFVLYVEREKIKNIKDKLQEIKFSHSKNSLETKNPKQNSSIFILSGLFITLLLGVLIPSGVIASSPAEFVELENYKNPLLYLFNSTGYAAGFFLLWSGIIRHMLSGKNRKTLDLILIICSVVFAVDYLFFGKNLGILSSILVYDKGLNFSNVSKFINLFVVLLIIFSVFILFRFKKIISYFMLVLIICTGALSTKQITHTQKILKDMSYIKDIKSQSGTEHILPLSKNGTNVIVFMLDRAVSGFIPYIFEEKQQLQEQFAGFTYYPNTLSFGVSTVVGTPPLFGGYEYTPEEINKRADEMLSSKQNEALKVLPKIFNSHNYNVAVCDPPYAGYKWVPDLSIYDDIPGVNAYLLKGNVTDQNMFDDVDILKRNFFTYSLFKTFPLIISKAIYDDGRYYSSIQKHNINGFIKDYSVLTKLPALTNVLDDDSNNFLMIQNSATHEPCMLQLPDYVPKDYIDNTGYSTAADGNIHMETESQIIHYHANMAALLALGKWFDYLRENDLWDNTRIIIVADHGNPNANQFDYMIFNEPNLNIEGWNPLLLVKDFNSTVLSTSNEFMTQADVPYLAVNGVIDNPVNPYTGKKISNEEKYLHPQSVVGGIQTIVVETCTQNTFEYGTYYTVHDDIFNPENWEVHTVN